MSHFQLCLKASGVAALTDIDVLLDNTKTDPFPALYQPYSEISGQDNLGHNIKSGDPVAHWHWEWLSQPDIDTLMGFEGNVYVRTEKREGLIRKFAVFDAYMQEPQIGEPILPENGIPFYPQRRGPVDVDFIGLVLIP